MNDQSGLNPVVTHAIEDMWILCDSRGHFYCCLKGTGPDDGPDWQTGCMLWFRCQEAAERFFNDETKHSNNLIVLVPRRMGRQWRKGFQVALNSGVQWVVGLGYQNGKLIHSPYYSIRDLLEGRLPKGLIARNHELEVEDEKRLAMGLIESTEWASCGEVFIQASLVPLVAKNSGLNEDVVATKLMVLAKVNVDRLAQAGEISFGQSETILLDGVTLHTLLFDGKVFISESPFYPYDTPPGVHGILLTTTMPIQAHDGQNRTDGRFSR